MPDVFRPNVLYILADDLGWADLSVHGAPIRTPNIDRLFRGGVELGAHYVCPMCTPTRASLLSGRHPSRFGPHATTPSNSPVFPDGFSTLATLFREQGYATGLFGKWHLGSAPEWGPNQFGFDYAYGSLAGGVDPWNHCYKRGKYSPTWHRNGDLIEEPGHVTDLILEEARRWLSGRTGPWFCYVPFTAVHIPVKPRHDWLDRYDAEHYDDDPARDLSYKKYAAYTSHMDWAVGQLLDTLEATNQLDDTIVVFASDNGAVNDSPLHASDRYPGWQEAYPRLGSNAPFRGVKAQLYEGGIRTPTCVSWRGTLSRRQVRTPVQVVDWMPTFAGLIGAQASLPRDLDGVDIWPLIAGESDRRGRDDLYWNFAATRGLGARLGDWKLILDQRYQDGTPQLFNLADDPYERSDEAARHPTKVKELRELVAAGRERDDAFKRPEVTSGEVG